MADIAFLLGDVGLARHDHHERLPAAFRAAGWTVTLTSHEALRLEPVGVTLDGMDPARFDLIWPLGLGRLETFLDRMQLLRLLPAARLVTPVDGLVYWHAKHAWWSHMPETYASADATFLKAQLARGGDWVVKPTAGSFGRDVMRIRNDPAGIAAIDRLTARHAPEPGRFCLLQRYVPEIERGETRTLMAGGRLIGSYLRRGADFRSNLAAGATPLATELGAAERGLVDEMAADLTARGIGFAAIDTAYPYLMEVNLANPGGLGTLHALYGKDPAPDVVAALAAWRGVER